MHRVKLLFVVLLVLFGCAGVTSINEIPNIVLGEPSFFPTIAAHTDAPILDGNKVEILLNGDEIFPGDAQSHSQSDAPKPFQAALMHAKTMIVDGVWATVGSTNLDNRSFALNEEINVVVHDRAVGGQLEKAFHEDLKHSKRLTYEAWKARPWKEKFVELFTIPLREQL